MNHFSDNISSADTKATFLIGILSALLVTFYTNDARKTLSCPRTDWGPVQWVTLCSLACLAAGILLGIYVVRPRLLKNRGNGLISWPHVSGFKTCTDYVSQLGNSSRSEILGELAGSNYDLSKICAAKYYWLSWSFHVGGTGLIATLLAQIISP